MRDGGDEREGDNVDEMMRGMETRGVETMLMRGRIGEGWR